MKNKVLNLQELSFENVELLNSLSEETAIELEKVIAEISEGYGDNLDWLLSSVVSRDIFAGDFFFNLCLFNLAKRKLSEDDYQLILVGNKGLKKALAKYLEETKIQVRIEPVKPKNNWKVILKNRIKPAYLLYHLFSSWVFSRIYLFDKRLLPEKELNIIDCFVIDDNFKDFADKNRYFPGITRYLNPSERERTFFSPNFFGTLNYRKLFREARENREVFIFKEEFLTAEDYYRAFFHAFRVRNLIKKYKWESPIEILFREELMKNRFNLNSALAILNYSFFKRLKEKRVKLGLVLDWFENQSVDKGFNLGVNTFFPEAKHGGYQGFPLIPNYIHLYPTDYEKKNKLIPDEILVMGEGLKENIKRFSRGISVDVAPAFRFSYLWNERRSYPDNNFFQILISLPMAWGDCYEMCEIIAEVIPFLKDEEVVLKIKPHPTAKREKVKRLFQIFNINEEHLVDGDFSEIIEKTNLLISRESSTCLETLARGIPVIVLGNRKGLDFNSIPREITGDIWQKCFDAKELREKIQFYFDRREQEGLFAEQGKRIRGKYFSPLSVEGVERIFSKKQSI